MTLVRAYVNRDSAEMYKHLFEKVFALLASVLNIPFIEWKYLHDGRGIGSVVCDMDSKQMAGN